MYNIVFVIQETYTEKKSEDAENTPIVHLYNRNCSPWQLFGHP